MLFSNGAAIGAGGCESFPSSAGAGLREAMMMAVRVEAAVAGVPPARYEVVLWLVVVGTGGCLGPLIQGCMAAWGQRHVVARPETMPALAGAANLPEGV